MKYKLFLLIGFIFLITFSYHFLFNGVYYESEYYKETNDSLDDYNFGAFLYYYSYLCVIIGQAGIIKNYIKDTGEITEDDK